MLTPPPSPSPRPRAVYVNSDSSSSPLDMKRKVGRRFTLLVVFIPLILIAITVSPRHLFHLMDDSRSSHIIDRPLPSSISPLLHFKPRQDSSSLNAVTNPLATTSTPTPTMPSSSAPPQSSSSARDTSVPTIPTNTVSANADLPTPFPQAFDSSLSFNFSTTECLNFFLNFTQSDDYRRCRPFSMLLGYSEQFAQAESNLTLLSEIIWGTCNTPTAASDCTTLMSGFADSIATQCKSDLAGGNLLAKQALTGFQMYSPMREAACLVDQSKNSYCFVEAAGSASPADLYFYELPYGDSLPNNTVPSCSICIKSVLAIYAQAVTGPTSAASFDSSIVDSSNSTEAVDKNSATIPLDETYPEAAELAVEHCGAPYAQQVNVSSGFILSPFYLPTLLCMISFIYFL